MESRDSDSITFLRISVSKVSSLDYISEWTTTTFLGCSLEPDCKSLQKFGIGTGFGLS